MKALLRNCLLLAGSLCFALLLAEVFLRITGTAYNGSFFQADPQLGWSLRPNSEGWQILETKNYVRINSDGLHDREHPLIKDPHTLRIAVLGDSCTESLQEPIEKSWLSVMGQQIAQSPGLGGRHVEVINFGVSGYGTTQELLTLRNKVWKYNPDIVLLAFYSGNDVFNNHRDLNPSVGAEQCPYFVFKDNRLVFDDFFRRSPDLRRSALLWQSVRARMVNHSRLVQLLYSVIITRRQRAAEKHLSAKATEMDIQNIDDQIYSPPVNPKLQDAWRVTGTLLQQMNHEVRAHGAEFWIVSLWTSKQVDPGLAARQQVCHQLGLANLSYPDVWIQSLAAKEQIPLILLAPAAAAYAEEHKVFLNGGVLLPPGTGHFNELGHRLAGNLIASQLASRSALIGGSARTATEEAVISCQSPAASSR